jgi:glycine cleavage system aminomethyltransferase T
MWKGLALGKRCYAMLLTRAGRITADLNIYNAGEKLIVEAARASLAHALPQLEKMILVSKVAVRGLADEAVLSVQGPRAGDEIKRNAVPSPHLLIVPHDRTGSGGYDLLGPADVVGEMRDRWRVRGLPLVPDHDVGWITSSTESPRLGPIALGYVKRDFWDPGTRLQVGTPPLSGAVVRDLPFTE